MENQATSEIKPEERMFAPALPDFGGISEVILGASMFGRSVQDVTLMPYLIAVTRNNFQRHVASFLFHHTNGRVVDNNSQEDKDAAWALLEEIQNKFRRQIEALFSEETAEEEHRARMESFYERYPEARRHRDHREDISKRHSAGVEFRNKHGNTSKPHADGTVAELAARLGVSKSEIRRMKTEGTLQAALDNYRIE